MKKEKDSLWRELKTFAEGLPFDPIELEVFSDPAFEPKQVRQPRTFTKLKPGMTTITRFLAERGTVPLLKPEDIEALFSEMHWCGYTLKKLAKSKPRKEEELKEKVIRARQLFKRLEGAEEELFIANRRLIVKCAKHYLWVGDVWVSDFLQEGAKSLSHAIRKFDYTRGTPFYSYAIVAVQNRMRNYFRDHLRRGALGVQPGEDLVRLKRILEKWDKDHDAPPPVDILAQMSGLDQQRVERILPLLEHFRTIAPTSVSLDAIIGDHDTSLHEILIDHATDDAGTEAERSDIIEALDSLPERSRKVLFMRFIEGRTLEETGDLFKLTRARIKQIQDEAVDLLRSRLKIRPPD